MLAIVSGANSNSQIFYSSYLSTYIERDVKELSDAIDSLKFLRFITAVAARCGQLWTYLAGLHFRWSPAFCIQKVYFLRRQKV